MAKAIIWCRVSTTEQEFESQKTDLIASAIKDGFAFEDLIPIGEAGASAIKMNELYQKEVNELIQTIQTTPEVTTIYVWEVSRLARNEVAFAHMKDMIINNHIQLICKVPQLKLLDDNGEVNNGAELTLNLLMTLAKQEMTIKKKRFSRGKKRLAEQGKYNGGAVPYGYRVDKERDNLIVIDEGGEADVVREIFNLYENGMSQPKIARELFKRGVKGRSSRTTDRFTMSLVHQILTNDLLTGKKHRSKGASFDRTYPMIITPEQFERCRRISEMNNTKANKSLRVYYAHRLILCQDCGRYFVSTGNKGYYHCWDAYYPNKDINGYPNIPRCPNRLCISTNIMDSLLWELAKEYEAMFVLDSAQKKKEECEQAIAVLKQKLAALPSLRAVVEKKMDDLLDALAEGMKKERFQKRKKALLDEQKELDSDEAAYKEQLKKYEILFSELERGMDIEYDFSKDEALDSYLDKADAVRASIAAITDDEERSRIIHKHINKVTIEQTTINYQFESHPEGKDASAKRILVYSYLRRNPEELFFLPNNGKGGVMLKKNSMAGQTIGTINVPTYSVFPMEYLPRICDKGKKQRREIARTRRENLKSQGIDKLRSDGYISMSEMRELSGLAYSTIYSAIKDGKMEGKNILKTWYVKKEDFEHYLQVYAPKPRPWKHRYSVYHEPTDGYDSEVE